MIVGVILLAILLSVAAVWGQNSAAALLAPEEGRKIYAERCTACHGAEAQGTSRGPELVGNRRLRTRTVPQISEVIRGGVPSAGMPAFDLPADQLGALSAFVRSLNSPA